MYIEQDLVRVAKRENNTKRKYLVVNPLQGKHIPAKPSDVFQLFQALAKKLKSAYPEEKLLLIGFAETATAIGAECAIQMQADYIQTTREQETDVEYLYFSEVHSHAAEQKLAKTELAQAITKADRIVFVEDEVTTGNTILNIIAVLEREYGAAASYAVASLLNGMDEKAEQRFAEKKISLHYLVKTDHSHYTEIAETYQGDGVYHNGAVQQEMRNTQVWKTWVVSGYQNARKLVRGEAYRTACKEMWRQMEKKAAEAHVDFGRSLLVLGTEECMYPALFAAAKLEAQGYDVKCHATTRSPIAVSAEKEYPLHERYELPSLYDRARKTFLYDIRKYDSVLILTDAEEKQEEGILALVQALADCGNEKIFLIRWC